MTDLARDLPVEPDGAPRIVSLDVMRGIAILVILFTNIAGMGGTLAASHDPLPSLLGWSVADRVAWTLQQTVANGNIARALLEMLFGAGMVMLTARMSAVRYYWRSAVLAAIGLAHVWLLLWPGDILHIYALSAMIAYPLRRLPARWLIVLGLTFSAYGAVTTGANLHNVIIGNAVVEQARAHQTEGVALTQNEQDELANLDWWHGQQATFRAYHVHEVAERSAGYSGWRAVMTGDWLKRYRDRRAALLMYWEPIATMLIGAALFKLGILQGRRDRRFYRRMTMAWYAVGVPILMIETIFNARQDDTVTYAWALNEVGRLATTLGHVGLIHLILGGRRAALLKPFAAAGRTALSLYILQTLICLWVLYPPWALALFGRQGWAGLMLTALAVDAALLMVAVWWTQRYPIAPVEWAWRSLAGGRALPFRPITP
ncbi:DUF418 domain-containing protein [Sphingomonas sp.]|uniref:DUF418 domain-containing protein n=1 Tax=Sphingomonas sp. TaxID=28214 RepID=UPI003CC6D764